jgi:hypothetical protein
VSNNIPAIIRARVEEARLNYARTALATPDLRQPAFAYGRACGFELAMVLTLSIISDAIQEDIRRDREPEEPRFAG